jgi:hypothetical protein
MILFLPETAFPRHFVSIHPSLQALPSSSHNTSDFSPKMTEPGLAQSIESPAVHILNPPYISLRPIPGLLHPYLYSTTLRFLRLFTFPNVAIPIIFYCWTWYLFILCVITMLPAAYPNYTPQVQGLLFLGFIIGTIIAEFASSGALSDRIVRRLIKNGRERAPEMRLPFYIPASLLTSLGLLLFGLSIQRGWHWMTGQIALALFAFGIQIGNTITTVYAVDCYPEYAMDVITFYSFHLNLSAFVSPFFIIPWINRTGWAWSFGGQALIVLVCSIVFVAYLQFYGQNIRQRRGPIPWAHSQT